MKKCCESTLQSVIKIIGEEVKTSIDGARSPLGPDPAIIIRSLYKIQDEIKKIK